MYFIALLMHANISFLISNDLILSNFFLLKRQLLILSVISCHWQSIFISFAIQYNFMDYPCEPLDYLHRWFVYNSESLYKQWCTGVLQILQMTLLSALRLDWSWHTKHVTWSTMLPDVKVHSNMYSKASEIHICISEIIEIERWIH